MSTRPDPARTLASLKDFQRDTVEYVFERLWTAVDPVKRFLVADEVGLGKTMVAKGLIAKTVNHLWETTERIDVVYICSNSQIARQNLSRLNVVGGAEYRHADRLTLLPKVVRELRGQKINFVSFTPGTSFNVGSNSGKSEERVMLYWMLADIWGNEVTRRVGWERFFEAGMRRESFHNSLARHKPMLDAELCRSFGEMIDDPNHRGPRGGTLSDELRECAAEFSKVRKYIPDELNSWRNQLIGRLRQLVAEASVHHLEPDLVILDEFQRFKDLIDSDGPGTHLAHAIFNHPDAKVLLLSATPYKMYTLPDDPEGDDHYSDFTRTIRFLAGDDRAHIVEQGLRTLREGLIMGGDLDTARAARDRVECELRRVMTRTERLASTPDRDGMLREFPLSGTRVTSGDLHAWRTLENISHHIGSQDPFEYWRSSAYPLNVMERGSYDIRKRFQAAVERSDPGLIEAMSGSRSLLDWDAIHDYRDIDPANAKMRGLVEDILDRGAWRLAWVPPALPYYEPGGPYADPKLDGFTKRLVFSAWAVVPKSIAVVLSYGAEQRAMEAPLRAMEQAGRERRTYGPAATSQPLSFTMSAAGRPTGMLALALLYPSLILAEACDPLRIAQTLDHRPVARAAVLEVVRVRIEELLSHLPEGTPTARPDQRWYWAAPFLLDQVHGTDAHEQFRAHLRASTTHDGDDSASGFAGHLRISDSVSEMDLGSRPSDLAQVLTVLAVAGPGICALRALTRVAGGTASLKHPLIRRDALRIAMGLRTLFNKPEIVAILRTEAEDSYWRAVLEYCLDGNLQSVLDEYAHVLIESEGLQDAGRLDRTERLTEVILEALSNRAANFVIEEIKVASDGVDLVERRMTSHFAARYGRTDTSEKAAQRESTIRTAFNSPFWPFVLASTSVGQEGLDFHPYSHAIVHWNLPGNPVDLEQREGRVHRYKGHAVRKNVAQVYGDAMLESDVVDPWAKIFDTAAGDQGDADSDICPFWVFSPPGGAVIERYVPAMPLSRELQRFHRLQRTVGAYRLVIGQPRQEDLVRYVGELSGDDSWLRIDLAPPKVEKELGLVREDATPCFDPETDDPLIAPNPWPDLSRGDDPGSASMAHVMLIGGILAINLRHGRGATADELKRAGTRGGRSSMKGRRGTWLETRDDGLWVTYAGRETLEHAARTLGLVLPADIAW